MSEKLFCSKCGKQNTVGDVFCSGCGNRFSTVSNDAELSGKTVIPEMKTPTSVKMKKGTIPGIILIIIGAIYLLADMVTRLGLEKAYVDTGFGMLALGILMCGFGAFLLLKRIKKYGWGIAATVFLSFVLGSIYPFEKSTFMGSIILFIISIIMVLLANLKK